MHLYVIHSHCLSFLTDPAAAARARPYLRRFSVQDPKLRQFQTRNISNFRRIASLPLRSKRPVLRTRSDAQTPDTSGSMSKGKTRLVGELSPTGIDRGLCVSSFMKPRWHDYSRFHKTFAKIFQISFQSSQVRCEVQKFILKFKNQL